jgi:hypothetical protein
VQVRYKLGGTPRSISKNKIREEGVIKCCKKGQEKEGKTRGGSHRGTWT